MYLENYQNRGFKGVYMAARPLGKYILIKLVDNAERVEKGIILTAGSNKKRAYGKILAIGKGVESNDIKVGDKIYFANLGIRQAWDKEAIIHYNDILYVLDE